MYWRGSGVEVGVSVGPGGVSVGVAVMEGVKVFVGTGVTVGEGVFVGVGVAVSRGTLVSVGVLVGTVVAVFVGVAVSLPVGKARGRRFNRNTCATSTGMLRTGAMKSRANRGPTALASGPLASPNLHKRIPLRPSSSY